MRRGRTIQLDGEICLILRESEAVFVDEIRLILFRIHKRAPLVFE